MKRTGQKQEWSFSLFVFGILVFLPPLVGIYDRAVLVMGIPLSYLIIFCIWAVLIFAIWLGARPSTLHAEGDEDAGPPGPAYDDSNHPMERR